MDVLAPAGPVLAPARPVLVPAGPVLVPAGPVLARQLRPIGRTWRARTGGWGGVFGSWGGAGQVGDRTPPRKLLVLLAVAFALARMIVRSFCRGDLHDLAVVGGLAVVGLSDLAYVLAEASFKKTLSLQVLQ